MKTTIQGSLVGMKYYGLDVAETAHLLRSQPALLREPSNPHDANAVAVAVRGKKIGHIDRQTAKLIAPMLDSGAAYEIRVGEPMGQSVPLWISVFQEVQRVPAPFICAPRITGIYTIYAATDVYVGQSKDIQNRIAEHWDQLNRGIHQNQKLRRLWHELGSAKFSAEVLESAPNTTTSLELARWLHNRECHWINEFGGLRNVLNAEDPRPVLDDVAKAELRTERDAAALTLQAMEKQCQAFAHEHDAICASLDQLKHVVSEAGRFWGIFVSASTKAEAAMARQKIFTLEAQARKTIDGRIALETKIRNLKRHIFL